MCPGLNDELMIKDLASSHHHQNRHRHACYYKRHLDIDHRAHRIARPVLSHQL
jgi:hypothetical protein